jgi:uncharacterized OsmC-like protein
VGEMRQHDKVLTIDRIVVTHLVRLDPEHNDEVRKVHEFYDRACPVSRSLAGAIEIKSELELV